ncbi:uncharacterized protein [Eurosta solidaginis]|uniref:uncharacterized protein n=1 Tax=Eurosta solidaginis TaxID=178769 RepID=UPI003530A703
MAGPAEFGQIGSRRKSTVWTREKITQLIELYQQHECLWNHYAEDYKHKEKRKKAIDQICSSLLITKMEFGKKIHNLRNQFNSEMKKLERRIEDTGTEKESTIESCRWKHFQSLKFLRDIIEPRPGGRGYQTKIRKRDSYFKYLNTSEEESEEQNTKIMNDSMEQITRYQFEDRKIASNSENNRQQKKGVLEVEGNPKENSFISSRNERSSDTQPTQVISQYQKTASGENQQDPGVRSCNKSSDQCSPSTTNMSFKKSLDDICTVQSRDQWDAFGELIATEFRNLNSDTSRKKLKRKILQAILEVGEVDDGLSR